ncbi:hypothetical protein H3N56_11005 [Cetobacterium sp. 2A]|nr:hypothetical protein [Cetobacterium sp. 2A]
MKKELEFAYSKKSDKFFTKNENIREIFVENIISIERGNCNIDVKLLKGYKDLFRMRIRDYRIIYKVVDGELIIIEVLLAGNRGDIYKKI